MNKNELAAILRFSHPKELYVVDWNNRLLLLRCPIKASVKKDIESLKEKEIVFIDEIKITLELITVFVVKKKAYFYYHFNILVD